MSDLLPLLALLIGALAVARAARLVTADTWPPMVALRGWWWRRTAVHGSQSWRHGWYDLLDCPFCFAPYAAAVDLTWALWSGAPWLAWYGSTESWAAWWWIVNTWAALSYLAAMIVARDTPED